MKRPFLNWTILNLGSILGLVLAACAGPPGEAAALLGQGLENCPVTRAPAPRFVPPEPYPEWPSLGHFWHGDTALWTELPVDHAWSALPGGEAEGGYRQKTFWWRQGYDPGQEPQPALTVTGRRLDGEAPPLESLGATHGFHPDLQGFMLVGVNILTAGCWEITGRYQPPDGGPAAELRYVLWVGP